ncbi:hypothetical protein TWF106_000877 [Orbilia oligospora]|uniref:Ricin B lectin domain-containing protein n=1 Tax=Orbilia oligospora TaxID=2813651 RepID=A0A7C8V0Z1_ORBOL|nr:hypothetical protein TWF679_011169 [Orbilia oligospora]KAF3226384.1 hypothetical protein TWF106_000877 [Orbilia oligospora]KAF3228941.1 hypothetical protein TWF191_002054 [Orbilia oligospora]
MGLPSGTYRISCLANQKMVGLRFEDSMNPGKPIKQVYARDDTDPTWKFEELGDGRYIIKTSNMGNVLAGERDHALCAFGGGFPVGMGNNGPCEWAVEEADSHGGVYKIHKVDSQEGWMVQGDMVSIGFPNDTDEEKFMIIPTME